MVSQLNISYPHLGGRNRRTFERAFQKSLGDSGVTPEDAYREHLMFLHNVPGAKQMHLGGRAWAQACHAGYTAMRNMVLPPRHLPPVDQWQIEVSGVDIEEELVTLGESVTYVSYTRIPVEELLFSEVPKPMLTFLEDYPDFQELYKQNVGELCSQIMQLLERDYGKHFTVLEETIMQHEHSTKELGADFWDQIQVDADHLADLAEAVEYMALNRDDLGEVGLYHYVTGERLDNQADQVEDFLQSLRDEGYPQAAYPLWNHLLSQYQGTRLEFDDDAARVWQENAGSQWKHYMPGYEFDIPSLNINSQIYAVTNGQDAPIQKQTRNPITLVTLNDVDPGGELRAAMPVDQQQYFAQEIKHTQQKIVGRGLDVESWAGAHHRLETPPEGGGYGYIWTEPGLRLPHRDSPEWNTFTESIDPNLNSDAAHQYQSIKNRCARAAGIDPESLPRVGILGHMDEQRANRRAALSEAKLNPQPSSVTQDRRHPMMQTNNSRDL